MRFNYILYTMPKTSIFDKIDKELGVTGGETINKLLKPYKRDSSKEGHINVPTSNSVHQADLLSLPTDKGYKYALVVVDLGTRGIDAEPLKTKTTKEVKEAFQKIYKRNYLKMPKYFLQVDGGTEFKSTVKNYFNDNNVRLKIGKAYRHRHQAVVEAMNKIISKAIQKFQLAKELSEGETNREWVDNLTKIIKIMNSEYKRTPTNDINENVKCKGDQCHILQDGDKVRIPLDEPREVVDGKRLHGGFRVGDVRYDPKVRTINKVLLTPGQPPMYTVSNDNKTTAYSKNQLQLVQENEPAISTPKTKKPEDDIEKFVIEKFVKKVGNKILVKWVGYPATSNTLEPIKQLKEDLGEEYTKFLAKM